MRMRLLIATVVVGAAVLAGAGTATAQETKTCADFSAQSDAQAVYNGNPTLYANLDADHDGTACENLTPGGAEGADTSSPTGPTQTGFGGLSGRDSSIPVPVVAGAAASTLTAAWLLFRRRTARI